jgi:hypothetical protein
MPPSRVLHVHPQDAGMFLYFFTVLSNAPSNTSALTDQTRGRPVGFLDTFMTGNLIRSDETILAQQCDS